MNRYWETTAPWVNRGLLTVATALFVVIGSKYIVNPLSASAADQISLGSPAAMTDMRVSGSMFLICGLITARMLFARERHKTGLSFVVTVLGAVTAARIYGFALDGTAPATVLKLRNEIVMLALFSTALFFESAGRRSIEADRSGVRGGQVGSAEGLEPVRR